MLNCVLCLVAAVLLYRAGFCDDSITTTIIPYYVDQSPLESWEATPMGHEEALSGSHDIPEVAQFSGAVLPGLHTSRERKRQFSGFVEDTLAKHQRLHTESNVAEISEAGLHTSRAQKRQYSGSVEDGSAKHSRLHIESNVAEISDITEATAHTDISPVMNSDAGMVSNPSATSSSSDGTTRISTGTITAGGTTTLKPNVEHTTTTILDSRETPITTTLLPSAMPEQQDFPPFPDFGGYEEVIEAPVAPDDVLIPLGGYDQLLLDLIPSGDVYHYSSETDEDSEDSDSDSDSDSDEDSDSEDLDDDDTDSEHSDYDYPYSENVPAG